MNYQNSISHLGPKFQNYSISIVIIVRLFEPLPRYSTVVVILSRSPSRTSPPSGIPSYICCIRQTMSGTLGVVASSAAVIQIVSQVSSGILKLRALLEEIKNDPLKIASLTKKIEILVPLLTVEAIQANFPPGDLGDATLKLCIRHCQRSSQAIADLAISLSKEVNSTR